MNQKDIFKEQLKSVFSDFEAPVPSDGWDKLEQSLNAIRRARIVRRNWYVGSAAATVAIILGSLFFLNSPQAPQDDPSFFTEEIVPEKAVTPDAQDVQDAQDAQTKRIETAAAAPEKDRKDVLMATHTGTVPEQTPEKAVMEEQPVDVVAEVVEEKKSVEPSQEEIDRLIREFEDAGKATAFAEFFPEEKKKKNKPFMLAMNAKGGLTSSQKTVVNSPVTLRSASAEKNGDKKDNDFYFVDVGNNLSAGYSNVAMPNNRNATGNVAEMEHDQPVSFGLTVSKTILDRLSVETGLVYTYLFSRAKNTRPDFQNQETQHFHYLGIPVNVNYNFATIEKLGLFASFGGMIEKDVYGELRNSGQSVSTESNSFSQGIITKKISQKNPQISVNAGLGAFYPIYGGFNLYGKIGGAYYFDAKNSEKTIYTDKKIVLDLSAGIRFDF